MSFLPESEYANQILVLLCDAQIALIDLQQALDNFATEDGVSTSADPVERWVELTKQIETSLNNIAKAYLPPDVLIGQKSRLTEEYSDYLEELVTTYFVLHDFLSSQYKKLESQLNIRLIKQVNSCAQIITSLLYITKIAQGNNILISRFPELAELLKNQHTNELLYALNKSVFINGEFASRLDNAFQAVALILEAETSVLEAGLGDLRKVSHIEMQLFKIQMRYWEAQTKLGYQNNLDIYESCISDFQDCLKHLIGLFPYRYPLLSEAYTCIALCYYSIGNSMEAIRNADMALRTHDCIPESETTERDAVNYLMAKQIIDNTDGDIPQLSIVEV